MKKVLRDHNIVFYDLFCFALKLEALMLIRQKNYQNTATITEGVMRASNRILLAVILLIAYACNQKKLDPSIINVPGDFKNIQSAIDFAEPGKTIKIKNGIYEEKIVFKDGVSIIGETAEGVIICNLVIKGHVISVKDCPTGLISNITVAQDDGDESEIDNIRSDTGGIRIENSDIQVKRCFFRNCLGPGIYITGASKPTISDCTFTENGFLGLLSSGPDAAPVITGNFFMKNIYGICFNEGSKGIAEKKLCNGKQMLWYYQHGSQNSADHKK